MKPHRYEIYIYIYLYIETNRISRLACRCRGEKFFSFFLFTSRISVTFTLLLLTQRPMCSCFYPILLTQSWERERESTKSFFSLCLSLSTVHLSHSICMRRAIANTSNAFIFANELFAIQRVLESHGKRKRRRKSGPKAVPS